MPEIDMPRMSDTMEEGRIVRWLKKVGDRVEKGDSLAEVETDKAVMELPSYLAGTLEKLLLDEGGSAPIGTPIAIIGSGVGASQPAAPSAERPAQPAPAEAVGLGADARTAGTTAPAVPESRPDGERLKSSPIARRIAEEQGVDLAELVGSGPGGRIIREDVERYLSHRRRAPAPPTTPAPTPAPTPRPQTHPAAAVPAQAVVAPASSEDQVVELSRMRRTIGERMAESKWPVPHFYITSEIDMGEAMALRKRLNEAWAPESVGVNDLIIRASALALRKFPSVNSSYMPAKDGQPPTVVQRGRVSVGLAVAVPNEGLLVPVVHDADRKGLREIAGVTKGLVERARAEKPLPSDFGGGTFSISNLGMLDVDEFSAVINPPESAILAVGSIKSIPVVVGGEISVGQRMRVTLSGDHRVFSGETGARFLQELKRLLQNPFDLLQ
jgi:pyruvate dehydrogenase E2 component (dihydrolipoamide acetyltransferase)